MRARAEVADRGGAELDQVIVEVARGAEQLAKEPDRVGRQVAEPRRDGRRDDLAELAGLVIGSPVRAGVGGVVRVALRQWRRFAARLDAPVVEGRGARGSARRLARRRVGGGVRSWTGAIVPGETAPVDLEVRCARGAARWAGGDEVAEPVGRHARMGWLRRCYRRHVGCRSRGSARSWWSAPGSERWRGWRGRRAIAAFASASGRQRGGGLRRSLDRVRRFGRFGRFGRFRRPHRLDRLEVRSGLTGGRGFTQASVAPPGNLGIAEVVARGRRRVGRWWRGGVGGWVERARDRRVTRVRWAPRPHAAERRLERLEHVDHRGEPIVGRFVQATHHDALDRARQRRDPPRGRGRRGVEVELAQGEHVVALERGLADQHLKQHAAERVDIGACVDLRAAELLGRHVHRRAQDCPGRGGRQLDAVDELGDPEIDDLGALAPGDLVIGDQEDVGGLEIAVQDADRVSRGHGARDLPRHPQRRHHGERPVVVDRVAEGLAVQQLHDDVGSAIVGEAEVEDLDDPGVIDRGGGPRLGEEAIDEVGLRRHPRRHDLDRRAALDQQVFTDVHRAHAAGGDLARDAVLTDDRSDRDGAHPANHGPCQRMRRLRDPRKLAARSGGGAPRRRRRVVDHRGDERRHARSSGHAGQPTSRWSPGYPRNP